jgi:hypothetical protein
MAMLDLVLDERPSRAATKPPLSMIAYKVPCGAAPLKSTYGRFTSFPGI